MTLSGVPADSVPPAGRMTAVLGRRRHWVIYRYVLQEFLLAFAVAFLFFFVIFIINQMLLLAENVLSKNVGVPEVLRLILYSLPLVAALSFPFGALVGALMAMGRLSSDSEIVAMRSLGVPLKKIFTPLIAAGILFSGVSFVINDYFLPLGNINLNRLYRELITSNPELELEAYSVKPYQNSTIITGAASDGTIEDLVIIEQGKDGAAPRVITSSEARVENQREAGVISLRLNDVFSHTAGGENSEQEYFEAEGMIYNILLRDITISIQTPGPQAMSSRDVRTEIKAKEEALAERRRARALSLAVANYELLQSYTSLLAPNEALSGGDVEERLQASLSEYRELAGRRCGTDPCSGIGWSCTKSFRFPSRVWLSCFLRFR